MVNKLIRRTHKNNHYLINKLRLCKITNQFNKIKIPKFKIKLNKIIKFLKNPFRRNIQLKIKCMIQVVKAVIVVVVKVVSQNLEILKKEKMTNNKILLKKQFK